MNKRILISLIAIAVLASGVGYAMWQLEPLGNNNRKSPTEDISQPITEADEQEKRQEELENNENNVEDSEQPNENTESEQEDNRKTVNPTLTRLEQDASTVRVRTFVENANEGTCKLIFKKSGHNNVTRSAPLALQSSYYVCQGFNVEKSAFPVKGEWKVKVEFSSNEAHGVSRTETIDVY